MTKRFLGWLSLAGLVIVIDQLTKWIVLQNLRFGQEIRVTDFFDWVLVYNPGAAFSFLSSADGWQRWFFIALAVVICTWLIVMLKKQQREILQPLAYSLVIGGALGNVIDRLLYGAVVDFLHFHIQRYSWPAFNVADSAICLGVALMVLSQLREGREAKTKQESIT